MQVHLSYGERGLDVELPEGSDVILPAEPMPLAEPESALRRRWRRRSDRRRSLSWWGRTTT